MKIVILSPVYVEGLEYQENLLVKYYARHGHEVHMITSTNTSIFDYIADRHDKSARACTYQRDGATVHRLEYALNILHRIEVFAGVRPILERVKPDFIFVRDILPNITDCVRYVKRNPDCTMILDYHADYSNSGKNWLSLKILHGVIRKWYLDKARPYLARIFPVTPGSEKFLREVYSVPAREMEILPLGADMDLLHQARAADARVALRAALNIPPQDVVIVTGGKLIPPKRTELLIDAFRGLPGQERLHLVIVGQAPKDLPDYYQRLLDAAGGQGNIHFTGWLTPLQIYEHLVMADLAVFPASQSILWQQAIAAGLPLVIGDIAGGDQDVSYLSPYGNVLVLDQNRPMQETLPKALADLVADAPRRQAMADGAVRAAAELLDWDVLVEKTLRFSRR